MYVTWMQEIGLQCIGAKTDGSRIILWGEYKGVKSFALGDGVKKSVILIIA